MFRLKNPVDIHGMVKDPEFQALPEKEQGELFVEAAQKNAEVQQQIGTSAQLMFDTPAESLMTGANIGEFVGSAAPVGPLRPVTGAMGAALGEGVEQWVRGEPLDVKRMGIEGGLSFLPEAAESAARTVGRQVLRTLPAGQRIRFDEAARQARDMVGNVFQPLPRETVGEMFEVVRQSGVRMDTGLITQEVRRLTPGKYDELAAEMRLLDQRYKTGGRYAALVDNLRQGTGPQMVGYDIGDLQQLRSAVRQRADQLGTAEGRQLLRDFQTAVDESIDSGLARGRVPAGQTPALLQQARAEWARLRAAEDMGQLVENAITSTPDLAMNSFHLRKFYDELRRGTSQISQSVNRALDLTPGARERFYEDLDRLSQQFQTIELPLADVAGFRRNAIIGGLGQMFSRVLLNQTVLDSPVGALFRGAITAGRGTISPNVLANLANVAWRGQRGSGELPAGWGQPGAAPAVGTAP